MHRKTKVKSINLNMQQEGGVFRIAGLGDPSKAASQLDSWSNGKGSYVYFGVYPQGEDGEGQFLAEPVKWRVLDADTTDFGVGETGKHTMLLWSDKVLDGQFFNENPNNTYMGSNVQNWLNGTGEYEKDGFCDRAFSKGERRALAVSRKPGTGRSEQSEDILNKGQFIYKDNSGLSGGGEDRCFLLSAEEMYREDYGFYGEVHKGIQVPDKPGNASTRLEATEYARSKGVGGVAPYYNYMVRSADARTDFCVGMMSFYGACTRSQSNRTLGVSPACNLDLSRVLFTSSVSYGKADVFETTEAKEEEREWSLTLQGGAGFSVTANSALQGKAGHPLDLEFRVSELGTTDFEDIQYDRISAMLVAEDGTVACYGKVGEVDAKTVHITLPDSLSAGRYSLKIFAEDVSAAAADTDYASNMEEFPVDIQGSRIGGQKGGIMKSLRHRKEAVSEKMMHEKQKSGLPSRAAAPESAAVPEQAVVPEKMADPEPKAAPEPMTDPGWSAMPEKREEDNLTLKGVGKNGKIKLIWENVPEAEAYIIYGAKGGKLRRRHEVTGQCGCIISNLQKGACYQYRVMAVRRENGEEEVLRSSEIVRVTTRGGDRDGTKNGIAGVKEKVRRKKPGGRRTRR